MKKFLWPLTGWVPVSSVPTVVKVQPVAVAELTTTAALSGRMSIFMTAPTGLSLAQRGPSGIGQRGHEQLVRPLAALAGAEVVELLQVDPVHRRERHELANVDRVGGLLVEGLDLLGREQDVLVLGLVGVRFSGSEARAAPMSSRLSPTSLATRMNDTRRIMSRW